MRGISTSLITQSICLNAEELRKPSALPKTFVGTAAAARKLSRGTSSALKKFPANTTL
ncbi:hypothetical protein GGQ64_004975 [Rhizobium azooxidifex]|uniref:Uncharacterized protein n=1 Tax=Mycoplana azooxidifex TaxID=1636188 RepID=A0A7W6GLI2_9HYPH|nr:hypothetical protein [Mycoplana azooxidifex]